MPNTICSAHPTKSGRAKILSTQFVANTFLAILIVLYLSPSLNRFVFFFYAALS